MNLLRKLFFILILLVIFMFPSNSESKIVFMQKKAENQYTAISFNIHRGTTKAGVPSLHHISRLLQSENSDFIALQEVDRFHIRSGFYDQIKWLADELEMFYVYGTNMRYGPVEYGNGILSKYPILDSGRIDLAYETEPRSLLWARVKTDHGDLIITSIHLGLDTKKRAEHFSMIEEFAAEQENPLMLMGDFNTLPDHPLFIRFRVNVTNQWVHEEIPTYIRRQQPIQIDYILTRGLKEMDSYSIPTNVSDHFPIILEFKMDDQPREPILGEHI